MNKLYSVTGAARIAQSPTVQGTSITFSNVTDNSLTINFIRGNGLKVLVLCKSGSAVDSSPINNNTYTPSTVFGSGSQIGVGNYVLASGLSTSIDVTGLTAATTYHFRVFEFNGIDGDEKYNISTATGNPNSQVTEAVVIAPTTQTTNLIFVGCRHLSWTRGNGSFIIVVARQGGAVNANPVDGVSYTASKIYGAGSQIGTGNFVVYKGTASDFDFDDESLAYSTLYGIRAYEFNGANGSEKYFTDTATGNPLAHTTISVEDWYLYHATEMLTRREPFDLIGSPTNSRSCTQMYVVGDDEDANYYYAYFVTEGDFDGGIDRSVRMRKSKTDGLPITQGWAYEAFEANGDPTSFLDQGPDVGNAYQNWGLMSIVDLGGGSKYGYYVANQSSAARYSVWLMASSDNGATWARFGITPVIVQSSGRSMFYTKVFKDGSDWWMFAQNYNPSALVEGHLFVGEIWHSTDGLAWTKISTGDIFAGRGLYGAVDISQPWKEGADFNAYMTINDDNVTGGYIGNSPTNIITSPNGKKIYHITWTDWNVFNTTFIIQRLIFKDSQAVDLDVRTYCQKRTHNGEDFTLTMSFTWRAQTGLGTILEPFLNSQVLTRAVITDGDPQFIGNEVYPSYVHRLFIPHESYMEDAVGSVMTIPGKEIITNTNASIVGSPLQARLNSMQAVDNGFVTFPNFNYDPNYFGVKIKCGDNNLNTTYGICGMDTDVGGGTHGWHIRKSGLFSFEIWIYGSNTSFKRYRVNYNTYRSGLDKSKFDIIGFLWQNGTLKVCVDLETDATVTKLQDDSFTAVQQTNEVLRMGAIYPTTNNEMFSQDVVGTMLFLNGIDEATETNWLYNDYV
jgi:hypothetical protein